MGHRVRLKCWKCGEEYAVSQAQDVCLRCNSALVIVYDNKSAPEFSRRDLESRVGGVWKYQELLPIRDRSKIVSLGEGGTHLHECSRLAEELGLRSVFVKDETTNPTGSFVDRGTTVDISRANETGYRAVRCASAGNLGASVAAYAAKAGMRCRLFLPQLMDLGKLYQVIAYGAEIEPVRDYEQAVRFVTESRDQAYLLSARSPFFLEGEKTTGYEICEDLGWNVPDRIVVPMGDGGHLSMIWKGIQELKAIGILEDGTPKMTGVQAAGAAPIVDAFIARETDVEPVEVTRTVPLDIGVRDPLHGSLAIRAITESKGTALSVTHRETVHAATVLARTEGIFAELAAASTIAGLAKLARSGRVNPEEQIVCVVTGAGLKDPQAVRKQLESTRSAGRFPSLAYLAYEKPLTVGIGRTKLRILELLSRRESYGYALWKQLKEEFGLQLKLPSVYQHLAELAGMSLVGRLRSHHTLGRRKAFDYALTERGRTLLKARTALR